MHGNHNVLPARTGAAGRRHLRDEGPSLALGSVRDQAVGSGAKNEVSVGKKGHHEQV